VHGRINFYRRPHAAVQSQVVHLCLKRILYFVFCTVLKLNAWTWRVICHQAQTLVEKAIQLQSLFHHAIVTPKISLSWLINMYCDSSITNMLSLNVFINDFPKISLVCCQVTRVRSVHNLKVFNFHLMLIATPSYSKFETIQLQREESAAKPNVSSKMFFIL